VTGQWLSQGTPLSSTNKTDRHDITEILLKVALNTMNQIKFFKAKRTPVTCELNIKKDHDIC
jgi:hypothetical protein